MNTTVQFQTVLYHCDKEALLKSIESIANAVRVSRENDQLVSMAHLLWGDASKEPMYTAAEIDALNKLYPGDVEIRYQFFNENTGTSLGHNRMLTMADDPLMVVMNPDVVINPRFFAETVPFFNDPEIGIVEAKQLPVEHHKLYDEETGETGWASMACSMLRRACYEQIGGFDPDTFFMYCDDVDISWRARLNGWKLRYSPNAFVYHAKRLSSKGKWQPTHAEMVFSVEATLLILYKYSWNEVLQEALAEYRRQPEEEVAEALRLWERRVKENRLPKQIDPEHRVSFWPFSGGDRSRFDM